VARCSKSASSDLRIERGGGLPAGVILPLTFEVRHAKEWDDDAGSDSIWLFRLMALRHSIAYSIVIMAVSR
jgi:hypothetical protein